MVNNKIVTHYTPEILVTSIIKFVAERIQVSKPPTQEYPIKQMLEDILSNNAQIEDFEIHNCDECDQTGQCPIENEVRNRKIMAN